MKRLRALGAAYFATDDAASGRFCIAGLEVLLQKRQPKKDDEKDDKKKDDTRKKTKTIENALAELRGLAEADPKAALDHFAKCEDLRKELLALAQLRAGEKEKAEKTAKQAADGSAGQAIPGLVYVEILLQLGKQKEAEEAWKKVAPAIRDADPDLPILKRIPLARVDLPPAKPVVEGIDNLGPLAWEPPLAPAWTLPDSEGKPFSVERCGDTRSSCCSTSGRSASTASSSSTNSPRSRRLQEGRHRARRGEPREPGGAGGAEEVGKGSTACPFPCWRTRRSRP